MLNVVELQAKSEQHYRSRRGSRIPQWFAERIEALAADGLSGREVGRRLGTSPSTACRVIRRMRATRLEQAISARLLADDDPPQIAKDTGCSLELANALRDAPNFAEE
jgi:IS30 family transposase